MRIDPKEKLNHIADGTVLVPDLAKANTGACGSINLPWSIMILDLRILKPIGE